MLNLRFRLNPNGLWQFLAAFGFVLFVSVMTASAQTTFAQFVQRDGAARNYVFTNNGNGTASFNSTAGGNPVFFFYSGVTGLPAELQGSQNATLTLTSNTSAAATFDAATNNFSQSINQIATISFIRDTPAAFGVGNRTNLLTVTIEQNQATADLVGAGTAAGFSASTPQQIITFTSDFLDFTRTNTRSLSLSLSGAFPALSASPRSPLDSFTASGTGTAAANPAPIPINTPTAASVNIGGRVMTSAGRGINRARVTLTDGNGITRTALTNVFGYYRFDEVEAGQTVVVAATAKRYLFSSQVISLDDNLTDLNFAALDLAQKTSF